MQAGFRKRFGQLIFFVALMACALFLSAGRLDWIMAWALLGCYIAGMLVGAVVMLARSPDLIAERAEFKAGAKAWDRHLAAALGLYGPLATWIVAGLNARFGWPPRVPPGLEGGALAAAALSMALVTWSMASNRFFSSYVRIQKDRGHVVASGGPYRYVRHPGYVGMLGFGLATPLILGSVWALIPAGLTLVVVVVRTALEDRTLQRELEGYQAYAQRVRYRLVPGLW
jgi:protein-S-isoprenylcysteine O-methyltransferase Ste14